MEYEGVEPSSATWQATIIADILIPRKVLDSSDHSTSRAGIEPASLALGRVAIPTAPQELPDFIHGHILTLAMAQITVRTKNGGQGRSCTDVVYPEGLVLQTSVAHLTANLPPKKSGAVGEDRTRI